MFWFKKKENRKKPEPLETAVEPPYIKETVCYECYETGKIVEKMQRVPAGFAAVKKYQILYAEEFPRFPKRASPIYALPFGDKPSKIYNGTDREGVFLGKFKTVLSEEEKRIIKTMYDDVETYCNTRMASEDTSLRHLSLLQDGNDFELIWVRNSGDDAIIPEGYDFIGCDVSYPHDCSGSFSIVNDCMFICRWHGCDKEGALFADDFSKLNDNGLFDDWQAAYDYMVKYVSESWTERGDYCILEIYKRHETASDQL